MEIAVFMWRRIKSTFELIVEGLCRFAPLERVVCEFQTVGRNFIAFQVTTSFLIYTINRKKTKLLIGFGG